ncbi:MAG TPA: hypothetical protein VFO89_00230, partial [Thermoanaerobaculia bacterium]|nr:hypothetical protein [Thermoanaerobaculia bacterium]
LSLMGDGDLDFDEFVTPGEPVPFWFTRVGGRVISSYPILPGFLNVPVYFVAAKAGVPLDEAHRAMLSMITGSLIAAASVVFFFLAASRLFTWRTAALAAIVYAFGTTVFSVAARGIWQHGPSLLFLTCAIWLLTRGTHASVSLAGLMLGFAVFNRPVNALIVAPLGLLVLMQHSRRTFALFAFLGAIPMALMSWYSITHWGSILNLGQYAVAKGEHDLFRIDGFFSGLAGILFNPSRGLFVFTPLFIFSFIAMARLLRQPSRNPLLVALSAGVLLTLGLYAIFTIWWGGSCFGYRLLTEIVPALMLVAAWGWETLFRGRAVRLTIALTAAISFSTHLLGAYYAPCGFDYVPNDINHHPERLWSVRDGELARCTAKALKLDVDR